MHRPLSARQPLQVYSTKPAPQVGMEKGKAQIERDDWQEGEEAGNPNAKNARIPPILLQNDRLMRVCLSLAHWSYRYETGSSRFELFFGRGAFPFDQQQSPSHSEGDAPQA
jgi:hypothetical protein